jgi:MFS family permease
VSVSIRTPSSEPAPEPPQERRLPGKGLLLGVCCVAQFMVILDLSIVNVALPSIQESLRFSSADLQWVIDAYAIVFAGFLMLAGRVSDILGQRRTFVAAFCCSAWRP